MFAPLFLTLGFSITGNEQHKPWTYRPYLVDAPGMEKDVLKELGRRIRERRKAFDWSQEEFASQAGIDRSYMGGVERGERNLSFKTLCEICAALQCDVAALTSGIPTPRG